MFDLWESLSSHLLSIYLKRIEDTFALSERVVTRAGQAKVAQASWRNYSTTPIREREGDNAAMGSIVAKGKGGGGRGGSSSPSYYYTSMSSQLGSPRTGSKQTPLLPSLVSAPPSSSQEALPNTLSSLPPSSSSPPSHPSSSSSYRLHKHAANPLVIKGGSYEASMASMDAILKRTEEVLALSARKSAEQKEALEKISAADSTAVGKDSGTVPVGESLAASSAVSRAAAEELYSHYRSKGGGGLFVNRSSLEKEMDALAAEEHLRLPPLVQKQGLSVEYKRFVVTEAEESSRVFREKLMKKDNNNATSRAAPVPPSSLEEKGDVPSTFPIPSPPPPILSPYPPTLPRRQPTVRQSIAHDKNISSSVVVDAEQGGKKADSSDDGGVAVIHVAIDWPQVQREVADELAAVTAMGRGANTVIANGMTPARDGGGEARRREAEAAALVNKMRPFQVTEVDRAAAEERSQAATSMALAVVESNRAFETMMAANEAKRLERLRSET